MHNFLRKMSLRKKLIMTSILCLMLPTILMLNITNVYSKWIIREHSQESATQSLAIIQSQIRAILEEMISVSNFIQFDAEIKTLLDLAKDDPTAAKRLTTRLEQIAGEKSDLKITLLLEDGRAYSDYSFYDFQPKLFFEKQWFSGMSKLSPFETLFLGAEQNYLPPKSADQQYVIITARAIMEDVSRSPYAYLIVSRTENTIRELFADFKEDIYLLDGQNRILSNRKDELIGQNFDSILDTKELESPSIIHANGENQLYISMPVKFSDWRLVSVARYEQLTEKLNGISRSGILVQILLAVSFLIALTYLLQRFTKPVKVLGQVAKKVEGGNLTIRSNIRGSDEVGSLGRSFDKMLDQIQRTLDQVQIEQELKRRAELSLLQAQIHPHFLFNVLSSIRMQLLIKQDEENAELIGSLSSLLRATISKKDEFITLYAELETIKDYVELMNFTMRHPIEVKMNVKEELWLEMIPRFIFQPIIENAYKHAFGSKGGIIVIRVEQIEPIRHKESMSFNEKNKVMLKIEIEDHGRGMKAADLEALQQRLELQTWEIINVSLADDQQQSTGIGLSNVYDRLKLIFGEQFDMTIRSQDQQGTCVTLMLPLQTGKEDYHV
ncbi:MULTISPECIES: sensor histidine kinase [unclassified Paenibacillus]|uniref:sensor histidine kinase n=1 Tax=unclassified Paenibacillus TaxID=185978 RepID=UPI000838349B|nr:MULTISPECIES: sensor histidine kinase [unclassified Paenibacillus]